MIRVCRADNPGPMTLTGTNTWLVPGNTGLVVVDPGPALAGHRAALLAAGPVELIVLTHRHLDHTELAADLADRTGAAVRAADATLCRPPDRPLDDAVTPAGTAPSGALPLQDGEPLPGGLQVIATPGHTDDSVCLLHAAERVILTGDTVLGTGSSVIMYGDGSVADSLASLGRLASVVAEYGVERLLPGHGPEVTTPADRLGHDIDHRRDRIAQVRAALAAGAIGVSAVTAAVHRGLDPRLAPAARTSIAAHLDHLGALAPDDPWLSTRS